MTSVPPPVVVPSCFVKPLPPALPSLMKTLNWLGVVSQLPESWYPLRTWTTNPIVYRMPASTGICVSKSIVREAPWVVSSLFRSTCTVSPIQPANSSSRSFCWVMVHPASPVGISGQFAGGDAATAGAATASTTVGAAHAAPRASVRREMARWSVVSMPRTYQSVRSHHQGDRWWFPPPRVGISR